MAKKILYLCPSFPYPADNGGKVVFLNHISFLKKNGFKIHTVFFDVDDNAAQLQEHDLKNEGFESCKVFSRKVPRVNNLKSLLVSLFYFVFNAAPRAYVARINVDVQQYISGLLNDNEFEYVICDHFTAFAFISNLKLLRSKVRVIYIAHNVESKVLVDQYRQQGGYFKKAMYYAEFLKTKKVEKEILNNVSKIITISSEDSRILKNDFGINNIVNIPEILPLHDKLWNYNAAKNLLFVGGTDYYPNYDAVNWLVNQLMPELLRLDKEIVCTIVGNNDNFKADEASRNIIFTGRISDAELKKLYQSSGLFISPVILGSGVKVKVLTALSYCIPILCTKESMMGIDYINGQDELIFDRDLPLQVAARVVTLLSHEGNQTALSSVIKQNMLNSLDSISGKWALQNV